MPDLKTVTVPDLNGPYNACPTHGFIARTVKYCPFCGRETDHIPPERRCPSCTEVVWFAAAKFCGMCGKELPLEVANVGAPR